jgi:hypothetical protein
VKNNLQEALACVSRGLPGMGAASSEYDFYNWTLNILKQIGKTEIKG